MSSETYLNLLQEIRNVHSAARVELDAREDNLQELFMRLMDGTLNPWSLNRDDWTTMLHTLGYAATHRLIEEARELGTIPSHEGN